MDKLMTMANSMMETASSIAMKQEACPTLIVELDGANIVMPLVGAPFSMDPEHKQQTFRLCRALIGELKPLAVGFASEVWIAEAIKGNDRMPSEREDRKEALVVTVEDGTNIVTLVRSIERWEGETKLGEVKQPTSVRMDAMRLYKVEELTVREAKMASAMAECIRHGIAQHETAPAGPLN